MDENIEYVSEKDSIKKSKKLGYFFTLVTILLLVLTFVFVFQTKMFIYGHINKILNEVSGVVNLKGDANTEEDKVGEKEIIKPFSLLRYMPRSANFSIITDPYDEDLFWFHGFAFTGSFNRVTGEVVDYTFSFQGNGASISDIARQGDFLLVGHQGYDLEILNTQTGELHRFTEKDGLASVSNIQFYVDQNDQNVVWVQNFEGLSMLDLNTMKLTFLRKPPEIFGSKWEPHIIYIDDEYIWANVNTNNYVEGAVVRIDKNNFNVDSLVWGNESFTASQYPQAGVVIRSSVGNDTGIVVEENNVLYVFNDSKSTWESIRVFERRTPSPRLLDSGEDYVRYRIADKVYNFSISTQTETLVQNLSEHNAKVKNNIDLRKDPWRDRYIMYEWRRLDKELAVFDDINTDPVWTELQPIRNVYLYADTELMDVFQDEILLYDGLQVKALNVHSWNEKSVFRNERIKLAQILPTKYLIFEEDYCDGLGCDYFGENTYRSTTTLLDRQDVSLITETSLNSDSFEYTFEQGDARGDIGFRDSQQATSSLLVFDSSTGNYATGSVMHYFEPYDHMWGTNKRVRIKHPDVPFQVEYINAGIGDYLTITHHLGTSEEATMTVPFAEAAERPFANNQARFKVSDVEVYDGALWFATNRGLIRMDIETLEAKVFTTKDGLFSNSINKVYFGDVMVIEHSTDVSDLVTGIFIYETNL